MKVAIMQPYFMPYLGYFQLINAVDEFILFDTPQYIRHGWIERNRILKLNGESLYIKVPLQKHKREASINSILINNRVDWKAKILAQLVHYKKKAPNYNRVVELLEDILKEEFKTIVELNYCSLIKLCAYMDISTPIKIWSEMDVEIGNVNAPDEWALNICRRINAKMYYNLPGGKAFFNKKKYTDAGIGLKFLDVKLRDYKQFNNDFVSGLSIIDILMFCDHGLISKMLNE